MNVIAGNCACYFFFCIYNCLIVRSCEYDGSNDKAISEEFPYTDFLSVVQEYGF